MISRRERRQIASLSHQPLERLVENCKSDRHRERFSHLSDEALDIVIKKEYPRFLALKTFCRDFTHPRFVAPSQLIGTIWKIHVIDEDDYETVCRFIYDGHISGHDRDDDSDEEDLENPGKFRLILYPQPEHRAEESKWTKKALSMTRRLYRLYFNEPPPMEFWGDDRDPYGHAPNLERNHHTHSMATPLTPPAPLIIQSQSLSNPRGSSKTVIKSEPENFSPRGEFRTPNSGRRRGSPSRPSTSSTPVRRATASSSNEVSTAMDFHLPPHSPSSSGGRSKRPHAASLERPATTSWVSPTSGLNHYGVFRPALRRRRISHEGLLLIVPITPNNHGSAGQSTSGPQVVPHISQPTRTSSDSYNVDTPFQVYMSVLETVRQLKEKIWSEKGVPVNRQVIWINDNQVMTENQKLSELGVAVGDLDDGLGSNTEGKDVIGLQVIKDVKTEPEDKSIKKPLIPGTDMKGKGG